MDLQGQGVIITGGASGIGFGFAQACAALGAHVMIADIEGDALKAAETKIEGLGRGDVWSQQCDVSRKGDMLALAETAFSGMPSVDIVFHNAGVGVGGPMLAMRDEDWRWVIDVNLWGSIHAVQAFAPRLKKQGRGGHLLFTSSFAGLVPSAGLGPYSVSKVGVIAIAEVLRQELRGDGINVAVLCPMRVATRIGQSGRNRATQFGGPDGSPEIADPRDGRLAGAVIDVDEVVQQILVGLDQRDAFIMTHADGRALVDRRGARLLAAFDRRGPVDA